ncbi:MAG: glycoside hydrolase [Candidatus Marinimicrobia bacterium]|nr:glycoside hydrolase [Candidatus Neomarinimicrobiota bacterium]
MDGFLDLHQLAQHAHQILQNNDRGTSTKPAPSLYPHQWNWDSAFIAIGLSHSHQRRAQQEIQSLLQAQWSTGMIPHIIFNPESKEYHPGPEYWGTELPASPVGMKTSGITQPPVIALAVLEIYKNASDKPGALAFLQETYPLLLREEHFLSTARDPHHEGLSFICHSWESGMDNSAIWDGPLHAFNTDFNPDFKRNDNRSIPANQRPSDDDYTRYSYLVQCYALKKWDQSEIFALQHFAIQSLLFNTLHLKSRQSLIKIAEIIGDDAGDIAYNIDQAMDSFESKFWNIDKDRYLDYDMVSQSSIDIDNISQFLPLFTGVPSQEQADKLISILQSASFWPEPGFGICTQAQNSIQYDRECYWRGPVWINLNWMIIHGLELYGRADLAQRLAHQTLLLVSDHGFYEYFNPETGAGLGSDSFSWTAALVLDLIASGYK